MVSRVTETLAVLDRETEVLLATVKGLDPGSGPGRATLCAGWDAAHLLTHVARNADALVNLVRWAVDGVEREAYASEERRAADIEEGALRPWAEIVADLQGSAERFRTEAQELTGPAGEAVVRTRTGTEVTGGQVVAMRLVEVVFHHVDLDAAYTFDDADPAWVLRTLRRGARQWTSRDPDVAFTLVPDGAEPLLVGAGGPEVCGSPGQLLRWLARGRPEGLLSDGTPLPEPPPWA